MKSLMASRRIILLVGVVILLAAAAVWLAAPRAGTEIAQALPTVTPSHEARTDYAVGECVKIIRPTYLRLGPGVDYGAYTNIPVRPQPPMTIIDKARAGLICPNAGQCNLRDEGWWWPVQINWGDTGDIDRGWLWQGEIRPCK